MLDNAKNLPNEPAALRGLVTSLASEVKSQALLIEKLRHQLAGMRQHQFGSRSEALDQLALRLEDEEIAASAQDPAQGVVTLIRRSTGRTGSGRQSCPGFEPTGALAISVILVVCVPVKPYSSRSRSKIRFDVCRCFFGRSLSSSRMRSMTPMKGSSFGRTGRRLRT